MFNNDLKKNAIEELEKSIGKYDKMTIQVKNKSETLFKLRQSSGNEVITPVETYINTLANTPKIFDKTFTAYKTEYEIFNKLISDFQAESSDINFHTGGSAVASVAAGVGTVALMPATAMAIATTFGTASTGAAIAGLSGAAATNAALAWLGGGALAAGGAGMAGGSAFLALAGPIGIGIGAVGLIGSGLLASSKNKEITEKANQRRSEIATAHKSLKTANTEINKLISLTKSHRDGVKNMLLTLSKSAPNDYKNFEDFQKEMLGALINHIESLSRLINKKVS